MGLVVLCIRQSGAHRDTFRFAFLWFLLNKDAAWMGAGGRLQDACADGEIVRVWK